MSLQEFFTEVRNKWSYAKIKEAERVNFNLDTMPEEEWKRFVRLSCNLKVIIIDLFPNQFTQEEVDIFGTIKPWDSDNNEVLTYEQQVVFDKFKTVWEQDMKEHNEKLMKILSSLNKR